MVIIDRSVTKVEIRPRFIGVKDMKRVVFNQKGGVGKTSIACNLAACFAKAGRKTLMIDMDPQGNGTHYLSTARSYFSKNLADFFEGTLGINPFATKFEEIIAPSAVKNLFLAPSSPDLATIQTKLEGRYKIFKLSDALDALIEKLGFEEVVIDTPPALNFYTISALMAADRVLIPFDCDSFSAEAVRNVKATVDEIRADHRPQLQIEGVVVNQFQANSKTPTKAIVSIMDLGIPILEPYLPTSVAMRESHQERSPIVLQNPKHKLAREYAALASRLMQ